ncbi:MAG: transporter [Burkholderiales bacterium]|nr:transporter [Burkholderiales bacterium]
MPERSEVNPGALSLMSIAAGAVLASLVALPQAASAAEGGTSHILPGATATLVDLPPASPGWFFKPMVLNYSGKTSVQIPTGAGTTTNMDATANTLVLGGGHTFEQTVLGGAHYSVAAFLPYTKLDVSANVQTPVGKVARRNSVSAFGDLTLVPLMLAWKTGNWQLDTMLPVYAPTGSYEKGRLGNPGLNYWTFDPNFGAAYSNKMSGFNAMLRAGYAVNTENSDTSYKSGALLHFEGALQQILTIGSSFLTLGIEAFYFDQATGDSGAGATLGGFKGRTTGVGPVLGYIRPLGKESLALELKWLPETDTTNRLKGDYVWLKMVYKF